MRKNIEQYNASDESDDEQADKPLKKKKDWNKFWTNFKDEVGEKDKDGTKKRKPSKD
jgi:hypothetical protein